MIETLLCSIKLTSRPEKIYSNLFTVPVAVVIFILVIITISVVLYIAKRGKHSMCLSEQIHNTVMTSDSLFYYWLAKQASSSPEVTVDVEMKQCAAYEITSLARKKVVMEPNPAYKQVKINAISLQ